MRHLDVCHLLCRCQQNLDAQETLLPPGIFQYAVNSGRAGMADFAKAVTKAVSAQVVHHGITVETLVWQAKRQAKAQPHSNSDHLIVETQA